MPPALRKLLLSALVLVAAIALAEGVCRLLGLGARQEVAPYVADWKKQWDGDFYVLTGPHLSRDGLRDWDREVSKPAGTLRVACLGDSVTHGYAVPFDEAFPTILEKLLREQGRAAEVFNVALPGWSTRQARIAYERIAHQYAPDRVLLGFCLNDVLEMHNNLERPSGLLVALYRHSSLVRALLRPEEAELHKVEELFERAGSPAVESGWRLCFEEIVRLRDLAAADGATFALLAFPFRLQVESGAPEPVPQRELERFCSESGIAFLDLLPALREVGPAGFIDEDHLSKAGAEAVARAILASGLSDG